MCKAGCRLLRTVPRLPVFEKTIETIVLGLYDVSERIFMVDFRNSRFGHPQFIRVYIDLAWLDSKGHPGSRAVIGLYGNMSLKTQLEVRE